MLKMELSTNGERISRYTSNEKMEKYGTFPSTWPAWKKNDARYAATITIIEARVTYGVRSAQSL